MASSLRAGARSSSGVFTAALGAAQRVQWPAMKTTRPAKSAPAKPRQQPRNESQRLSILEAASRLFIERGYGGTNINDIADALGVTRTAVYYYFDSKDAILEALTEEVTEKAGALSRSVSGRSELSPEELLRQLVVQHATLVLTHPVQFRVVERNESSLQETRRKAARAARHNVLDNFVQVIRQGVEAGVLDVPDEQVAAFAIIGMCNWSAWWFEGSGMTVDAAANAIAELALRSVAKTGRRSTRAASAPECIRRIRENLDALEELSTRQRANGE